MVKNIDLTPEQLENKRKTMRDYYQEHKYGTAFIGTRKKSRESMIFFFFFKEVPTARFIISYRKHRVQSTHIHYSTRAVGIQYYFLNHLQVAFCHTPARNTNAIICRLDMPSYNLSCF